MNKTIDDTGITIVNYNETKKRMYIEKMYFNLNNWFEFIQEVGKEYEDFICSNSTKPYMSVPFTSNGYAAAKWI